MQQRYGKCVGEAKRDSGAMEDGIWVMEDGSRN